VSRPDVVVQLSTCLPDGAAALFQITLEETLTDAMRALDVNHDDPPPDPDVRRTCASGKQTFGGWLRAVGSYGSADTSAARELGLGQVNVLTPGDEFALHFRSAGLTRLLNIRWQDQPRRLDEDGNADPEHGNVHLTNYKIEYTDYDYYGRTTVDLRINGWYDGPTSNTNFTAHVFDALTVNAFGGVNCETTAFAEPTETTFDSFLASLVGAGGISLDDGTETGPGCRIAQMLPRSLPLPASGLKVVFTFTRVNASNGVGLTLAGTWELLVRNPAVWINGPVSLVVEPGEPIVGHFDAYPSDLRYPLTFSWTSQNGTASGSDPATITWNLPSLGVGQTTHRTVTLVVTDADGFQASAWRQISISKVAVKPTSPFCQNRPWLEECQEP
jgi:hypothetical protein